VLAAYVIGGANLVSNVTRSPIAEPAATHSQSAVETTPTVAKAEPSIKGPAPLPKEEQGLPG
jgi:hypothetical protein